MKKPKNTLKNKMSAIICNHCKTKILSPELVGLTLVCPHCKRSVNGQYLQLQQNSTKELNEIKRKSKNEKMKTET